MRLLRSFENHRPMDDSRCRLNFNLRKNEIYHHNYKEHIKIIKNTKFGCEMLLNEENIAVRSLQKSLKVVIFSARNTKIFKICEVRTSYYIFLILQHFATKLCNFNHFKMLFLAVVVDFVLLPYGSGLQSNCEASLSKVVYQRGLPLTLTQTS